ncbi:MAG: DNA polymerase IV [Syntrophomonadaceae bacterium]|nr:DNA polymerase IV [Syntrophomonadaceae bacterium]
MERVILHSDLNNFYASVECLYRPKIRNCPVAVCGDPSARHGIVLAKNYLAKSTGIKTGEAIWQAVQKCPNLVVVPPNFPLYLKYSRLVRKIYSHYTDQIEPFGLDESWLDVTGSSIYGTGERIANEIRERVKAELGVTVSIGVSWNKIFAKLGSDMKKPDATTIINHDNYQQVVWPLPAGDLLYVGKATQKKLYNRSISTIGDIANAKPQYLRAFLGKWGEFLWVFANGYDESPVTRMGTEAIIKSIGNSSTTPRDLKNDTDVSIVLYALCESVSMRLREQGLKCTTVEIYVRDNELFSITRQQKQQRATDLSSEIHDAAMAIFKANYSWVKPIRTIGVRGYGLISANNSIQLSFFDNEEQRLKLEHLESTIDDIRRRFGNLSLQRAVMLSDRELGKLNPKDDHIIHPVGYF